MFGAEGEGAPCEPPKDENAAEDSKSLQKAVDEPMEDISDSTDADDSAFDVDNASKESDDALIPANIKGLEQFVEYVAKNLVDNPDAVSIATVEKGRISVIQIRCEKKDIGKIIGKTGKTIAALRLLVSGASGRMGLRVTVDVLD